MKWHLISAGLFWDESPSSVPPVLLLFLHLNSLSVIHVNRRCSCYELV